MGKRSPVAGWYKILPATLGVISLQHQYWTCCWNKPDQLVCSSKDYLPRHSGGARCYSSENRENLSQTFFRKEGKCSVYVSATASGPVDSMLGADSPAWFNLPYITLIKKTCHVVLNVLLPGHLLVFPGISRLNLQSSVLSSMALRPCPTIKKADVAASGRYWERVWSKKKFFLENTV